MRLIVIGAALCNSLFPTSSLAQNGKDWHQTNPIYPAQQQSSGAVPSQTLPTSEKAQAETEFARDLMENCLKESSQKYCDCAVQELLTNQSLTPVYEDLDLPAEESPIPPSVAAPINACLTSK
ncbi:hypothetical protein C1752_01514 [Acaryochloris thomasi RCC1774]|uniref:Uncharacterized protein n=1 Tax=Acaryochloris thomasi RCC1774 TaxID=1764569 RepID=A0A2W1JWD6_9CYAN|nr:hypothetical protein [Acaryochloris thomasi]PZD73994.1 hypothetical protein C1752_01514 [Acaryochloris thomasi RCC1774]